MADDDKLAHGAAQLYGTSRVSYSYWRSAVPPKSPMTMHQLQKLMNDAWVVMVRARKTP